jgi:hypothetical protein
MGDTIPQHLIPIDKLAGKAAFTVKKWKAAFTIKKSVRKGFYQPKMLVTVSPIGEDLSRPTFHCRPTVSQLCGTLPTDNSFPTNISLPTHS